MPKQQLSAPSNAHGPAKKVAQAILDFIGKIPTTDRLAMANPLHASRAAGRKAASKAALTAGALALPPGPLGWLTLLPELTAVWKIQSQLVADIAAIYGKEAQLTQEQMLYCLFRHTTAQAVRDLVVRAGERLLVRRATLRMLQAVAQAVGIRVTQRVIGKGVARWLPVVGAAGVGAYAFYDTHQVAASAISLFSQEFELEEPFI